MTTKRNVSDFQFDSITGKCVMENLSGKLPTFWDFLSGPVVKNLPSNTEDSGLISGWGTKIPHATGQPSWHVPTTELHMPQ